MKLLGSTRHLIESSIRIPDCYICVRELVHNSVDAGSVLIRVHLDFREEVTISVRDNGSGIRDQYQSKSVESDWLTSQV